MNRGIYPFRRCAVLFAAPTQSSPALRRDFAGRPTERNAMTASATSNPLRFEPPGPGSWEQDPVHFPRPLTRYFQETHPPAFKLGTHDFAVFYGMIFDGLQIGYVHGFGYNQLRPAPEAELPERSQRA